MNSNSSINIKDFLETLKTENGKNIAIFIFIKNNMITEKSFYDKLIIFFQKQKNFYLAGEISRNLCENFFKVVQNQQKTIKTGEERDTSTILNFKINELKNLQKEYSNILSKTIYYYESLLLYENAGKFLEEHANSIYEESKYHDEQAKIFLNKSVFEDAKRSAHTSKYFKKKAKQHEKESNSFYLKSLNVYERAVQTYEKSLIPDITVKITKTYRMHYALYIEKIKGINKAINYARKKCWYDIAAFFAKKNKQQKLSDSYYKLYEQKLNKLVKNGTHFEELGKIAETSSQKYKRKSEKLKNLLLNNSAQNKRQFDKINKIINFILKPFRILIANSYLSKSKKLLNISSNNYQKASFYFTQAEMLGKISELQGKIITIPKEYANICIETEYHTVNGNSVEIFEMVKKLEVFIESCEKANQKKYLHHLKIKKTMLDKLILKLKKADELEIKAEAIKKQRKKEKILKKAMLLYEEAGCFKIALDIAKKINMNDLADCYRLISELNSTH